METYESLQLQADRLRLRQANRNSELRGMAVDSLRQLKNLEGNAHADNAFNILAPVFQRNFQIREGEIGNNSSAVSRPTTAGQSSGADRATGSLSRNSSELISLPSSSNSSTNSTGNRAGRAAEQRNHVGRSRDATNPTSGDGSRSPSRNRDANDRDQTAIQALETVIDIASRSNARGNGRSNLPVFAQSDVAALLSEVARMNAANNAASGNTDAGGAEGENNNTANSEQSNTSDIDRDTWNVINDVGRNDVLENVDPAALDAASHLIYRGALDEAYLEGVDQAYAEALNAQLNSTGLTSTSSESEQNHAAGPPPAVAPIDNVNNPETSSTVMMSISTTFHGVTTTSTNPGASATNGGSGGPENHQHYTESSSSSSSSALVETVSLDANVSTTTIEPVSFEQVERQVEEAVNNRMVRQYALDELHAVNSGERVVTSISIDERAGNHVIETEERDLSAIRSVPASPNSAQRNGARRLHNSRGDLIVSNRDGKRRTMTASTSSRVEVAPDENVQVVHSSAFQADPLLCVVCQDRDRCIALEPCMHLSLCEVCGYRVNRCPLCMGNIGSRKRIYL